MKKIFIWLAVFIMATSIIVVFSASGCKATTAETKADLTASETVASVTTAAVETTAAIETTAGEPIELVLFHQFGLDEPRFKWFEEKVLEYQSLHPNITITLEATPPNELQMMMQSFMAAGRGPDIMVMWEGLYLFPEKDLLNDFKELLTPEQIAEFKPEIAITSYYNFDTAEKLLGIPGWNVGFFHYYYNKAMFKDAGVTWEPTEANDYTMTWTEFNDACKKLKDKGYAPIGWGNEGGAMSIWYIDSLSYNYLQKDDWKKLYKGELKWNDQKFIETATRLNELVKADYFNKGGLTLDWNAGINLVKNKEAAMSMAWFGYNTKETWEALGDDYGMMKLPVINPENPLSKVMQASCAERFVIPTWCEHPKEAADFIYFMVNKENSQEQNELTGGVGTRLDFDSSTIPSDGFGPYYKLASEWLKNTPAEPSYENVAYGTEVTYELYGKSVELFTGKINEQQFCDALKARFDQLEYPWITTK